MAGPEHEELDWREELEEAVSYAQFALRGSYGNEFEGQRLSDLGTAVGHMQAAEAKLKALRAGMGAGE
jgi:hypothetical protein